MFFILTGGMAAWTEYITQNEPRGKLEICAFSRRKSYISKVTEQHVTLGGVMAVNVITRSLHF